MLLLIAVVVDSFQWSTRASRALSRPARWNIGPVATGPMFHRCAGPGRERGADGAGADGWLAAGYAVGAGLGGYGVGHGPGHPLVELAGHHIAGGRVGSDEGGDGVGGGQLHAVRDVGGARVQRAAEHAREG